MHWTCTLLIASIVLAHHLEMFLTRGSLSISVVLNHRVISWREHCSWTSWVLAMGRGLGSLRYSKVGRLDMLLLSSWGYNRGLLLTHELLLLFPLALALESWQVFITTLVSLLIGRLWLENLQAIAIWRMCCLLIDIWIVPILHSMCILLN